MSQQEDDLRALAKIMDFLRAVSIILVVMNVYWFCYEAIRLWGVDIGVVDRILMNFDRTAGLFRSILYTKLFAVLLLALSCLGTKGVKGEKITWGRIWTALAAGFVLFFLNWWILALPLPVEAVTGLYVLTVGTGYVCLLMGGLWMSRLLKHNLMDDVFNNENESFMQETRLIESEYSVNLPTRFYYRKRWNNGWINVVNPFRGTGRTEGVIFVRLTHWLKLNVNHLKSVICAEQKKKYQKIRKGMTSGRLGTWLGNRLFSFPKFPKKTALLDVSNSTILFPTVG